MDINTKEVLRYLGYKGCEADEKTLDLINHVKIEIITSIQPRSLYRECKLEYLSDSAVKLDGIEFHSEKLVKHLRNSDRILLFAATLGMQSDILVRRYAGVDTARAAVMQAATAAAVESFCDDVCENIAKEEEKRGYYLRPRFSPGYADLSLESQKEFFKLLDCTKRIGLTLSENCMMIPTKSVTAFIGLTKDKDCNFNACAACGNKNCEFRRG